MYNFNEINNLSELKETCFYIKAINESGTTIKSSSDLVVVQKYLKEKYNLEITVSKLYLFVQKITTLYNKGKTFPKTSDIDDITKAYITSIRKETKQAEEDIKVARLNLQDPKLQVGKNCYDSSENIAKDITIAKAMYHTKKNSFMIWSCVISLFIIAFAYCLVGIFEPKWLENFSTKPQEVLLVILAIVVLAILVYWCMYLYNYKLMHSNRVKLNNYNKHYAVINYDVKALNDAKYKLYELKEKFSINGIEMTDNLIYEFLMDTDDLDIMFYNANLNKKEEEKHEKLQQARRIGPIISKQAQNKAWEDSELSKLEKMKINQELVVRVDALISYLHSKGLGENELSRSITSFYCNELSIASRKEKIDKITNKYQLDANYIEIMNKITEFEKVYDMGVNSYLTKYKQDLVVSTPEQLSFSEEINTMFNRIEKAITLGLLSEGQVKSFKKTLDNYNAGLIQGVNFVHTIYRYDYAKLYVNLCDELSVYDLLN